jgi:hypothetical protein
MSKSSVHVDDLMTELRNHTMVKGFRAFRAQDVRPILIFLGEKSYTHTSLFLMCKE